MSPVTRTVYAHGFTMVEMIITIVIVGIISVLGAAMMGKAFESYDLAQKTTDVDWQGRVALERMARELRNIRSATATDIAPSATSTNPIRFIDGNGSTACFVLSAGSVQRGDDGPAAASCVTNLRPLADNVVANGLNFYYYDSAGTATAVAANVFYITVTLQVTEGTITETYRTSVQPRRF